MRSRFLLTGRDSRGAADCWEHVNSLSLAQVSCSYFHPLISHKRLTWRCGLQLCLAHTIHSFILSHPVTCRLVLNLLSTPFVAHLPAILVILFIPPSYLYLSFSCRGASLHILALLINNPTPLAQRSAFPPALVPYFSFEGVVRQCFLFHPAPSLKRRDLLFFFSTYNISSSLLHFHFIRV